MAERMSNMLHNHFKPTKRGVAGGTSLLTPKNDIKSNPFLDSSISTPSISSSSITKDAIKDSKHDDYIQPCATGYSSLRPARSLPLPDHLSTLLSLHSAVEHALIVHLATSGGTPVDSAIAASSTISLPCIITYTTLKPIVERSCGRRLGNNELSRLMWIWGSSSRKEGISSGCNIGFHISKGKTMDRVGNRSFDYFFSLQVGIDLPLDEEEMDNDEDISSHLRLRRKRILSGEISPGDAPTTPPRKRIHPMSLPDEPQTPSPSPRSINAFTRQTNLITPPSSPSSIRSPRGSPLKRSRTSSSNGSITSSPLLSQSSGRGLTSLIAIWNSGIDGRKREVRKRLQRYTIDCYETWQRNEQDNFGQPFEQAKEIVMNPFDRPCTPPPSIRRAVLGEGGILTPSSTREDDWVPGQKRIIDLFDESTSDNNKQSNRSTLLRKWNPAFPLNKVAPIPTVPLPEAPISSSLPKITSHPVLRPGPIIQAARSATTSQSNASMSLTDRIKAKEEAKKAQMQARSGLGLMNGLGAELLGDLHTSRNSMMANLKRKSALSRLQDVAESLYMLFSSKATSSVLDNHQSSMEGIKRYPLLPMNDVIKSICTSSKVAISEVEARDAFRMLQDIAPGFLEISRVGAREWIRMGSSIIGGDIDAGKQGGILNAVRRSIRIEMTRN